MLKTLSFVVCILAVVLGLESHISAQNSPPASKDEELAARRLENVLFKDQRIERLLSDLSFYYDIPIGLEVASSDEPHTYHDDIMELPLVFRSDASPADSDFRSGTLAEVLTQIVSRHDYYTWAIKDGVVNVFPKNNHRDAILKKMLLTKISKFAVKKRTACMKLEESLVNTPEMKKFLKAHEMTFRSRDHSGFYLQQVGRTFTLNVSDAPLKTILNQVSRKSPTAKFWMLQRWRDDRRSLYLAVVARHEGLRMENGKLVSSDLF